MKKILLAAFALPLLAGGCTPMVEERGNLIKNYQLAEVKTGVDNQSDILKKLGSPTTKAPFDDNTWYYLGQRTEKRGIFDAKIVEERVVELRFDDLGTLQSLRQGQPSRLDVPYVRDKTPTSGNEITAIQQFMGNLGKFNKEGNVDAPRGSGEGTQIP